LTATARQVVQTALMIADFPRKRSVHLRLVSNSGAPSATSEQTQRRTSSFGHANLMAALRRADASLSAALHRRVQPRVDAPAHAGEVDRFGLCEAWLQMSTGRDLEGLLDRFGISEIQALRLIGSELARPVSVATVEDVLEACVDYRLPVTVVVEDGGARRTQSGRIFRTYRSDSSLVLIGSRSFVEIRDDLAEWAWIVRRPLRKGMMARLELYSRSGTQLATILGVHEEDARIAWAILISAFSARASG
jgi:putative heme degradation protein